MWGGYSTVDPPFFPLKFFGGDPSMLPKKFFSPVEAEVRASSAELGKCWVGTSFQAAMVKKAVRQG